jgi:ureidoacrylate peracid hydrolase
VTEQKFAHSTPALYESTVRDAMFRDYACVLLEDCMGEPIGDDLPRSNHDASLLTMQTLFGWVSNSEEFLKALALRATATIQVVAQ